MKILTKEEVQNLEYSKYNPEASIVKKLRALKVGQVAQVSLKEWWLKSPPHALLNNASKFAHKYGYQKFTTWKTRDGKAYIITRIK